MNTIQKFLSPPESVRVWRGFRLSTLPLDQFFSKLGTVFIPATVQMQIQVGLHSYTPTVSAGLAGKPDAVPDETAILFWESQKTYQDGFNTLAVRTYTLTHNGVYITENHKSRADFPVFFSGQVTADQPIYLFDRPADWMQGPLTHLIGARPASQEPEAFCISVAQVLTQIQREIPLDGALACLADDYVVYWELASSSSNTQALPTGIPLLQEVLGWNQVFAPAQASVPAGLWEAWPGMDVQSGSSFNMQFQRRTRA